MVPSNSFHVPLAIPITLAAAQTTVGIVDTKGYDYCSFNVDIAPCSAGGTGVTSLRLAEADYDAAVISALTDCTAYTTVGMSAVTQFVGAAAVSTSAGFVLPVRSVTTRDNFRLNVDLRNRKRFLLLEFSNEEAISLGSFCMSCDLSRAEDHSALLATTVTTLPGSRLIVNG